MLLPSYLSGGWIAGEGAGAALNDPTTGAEIARVSADGIDIHAAFAYARDVGGPALKEMGFAARGRLLSAIAGRLNASRDVWYRTALANSGSNRADAAMDIEGAIQTLRYYGALGEKLGDAKLMVEPGGDQLTRDPAFQSVHFWTPINGAAVHINAFNFPAWGMWGKAAVALLSGVPVITKPAVSTSMLAWEMLRDVTGLLPRGAMSLLMGSGQGLMEAITRQDVVAFTGSAQTAQSLRSHARVKDQTPRFNVEADSLNASILGPDITVDSPLFKIYVNEMSREILLKAGQKCTTARRLLVSRQMADALTDAITANLQAALMGNPRRADVGLGPLVTKQQQRAVQESINQLCTVAKIVYRGDPVPVDADATLSSFIPAHLLRCDSEDAGVVHELEAFGPCATILAYDSPDEAIALVKLGGGSLVCSMFSNDAALALRSAQALGHLHGRVMLVDDAVASTHTDHSIVMPQSMHGGPGRAGGGEELGGTRGMRLYHQRTALQASVAKIAALRSEALEYSL
ncbi:MAG: maoC [Hymenobacter sp.]|nr:maoC [Hymenobacter sp.]